MYFLLRMTIFKGYVSFRECKCFNQPSPKVWYLLVGNMLICHKSFQKNLHRFSPEIEPQWWEMWLGSFVHEPQKCLGKLWSLDWVYHMCHLVSLKAKEIGRHDHFRYRDRHPPSSRCLFSMFFPQDLAFHIVYTPKNHPCSIAPVSGWSVHQGDTGHTVGTKYYDDLSVIPVIVLDERTNGNRMSS